MNDALMQRRHRREGLELQLTAMIDIFSMIVIFLIFGTVFGAAELVIPSGMSMPRSISKEGVESAPRVVIGKDYVQASFLKENIPLATFKGEQARTLASFRDAAKDYVKSLPKDAKGSGALLNVIADQETPYEDIFGVVRVFRESGFEAMLFVALGEETQK
ncbi:MAG: biopolymer transporter ExbD [Oligoflexia bacterium]|nr:biopolymer transporter ExbD [Oligoflexia bacterium]